MIKPLAPPRQGARVVCISLHTPDSKPNNAGVSYLSALVDELGAKNVLVVAPDSAINRQSVKRGGFGRPILLPVTSAGSSLRGRRAARWQRAFPVRPEPGFFDALLRNPEAIKAIRDAEIIDLQWPPMTALVSRVRKLAPSARIIVTPHDVSSQRFKRQLSAADSFKQRLRILSNLLHAQFVERRQLPAADTVVLFSQKDQDLLPASVPSTIVLPRITAPVSTSTPPVPLAVRPTATIVGPLSRTENWDAAQWLVSEIWPAVHRAIPKARLVVAGSVSEAQRSQLSKSAGVEVRGFVDDLEALYTETTVVVAPIRQGAGVKFKVLDALVRGIPVVATSVGVEGIGDPGFYPSSFDTAQEFSRELVSALKGSDGSRERAENAQRWAIQRFGAAAFHRSVRRVYGPSRSTQSISRAQAEPRKFEPIVSVVIPVRNGEHTLGYELAALAREPEAPVIEVIVSNNGSSDRTTEVALSYAGAFGRLCVVDSGDVNGVGHARNVGITHAAAEKVLICDADDEVRPGWIKRLSSGLDDFDVVGGRAISSNLSGVRALSSSQDQAAAERVVFGYLPYVLGGCMGVRRAAALAVGGFDEAFLRGHEEVDFCWRLQQSGFTLKGVEDAILDYRQRDRARDATRQQFHSARTQVLLWTRHSGTGELSPVSFKGSIRRAIRSLAEAPKLLNKKTRFAAARNIGWCFGLVNGHLRYRIAGSPPLQRLMERS